MLPVDDDDQVPESATDAERSLIASLGTEGIAAIDDALLKAAGPRWQKVASVVLDAIRAGGFPTEDDQVILHVRRIVALVDARKLEAQGNLLRPRFSEVRLLTRP
jgi:hypothetical protein